MSATKYMLTASVFLLGAMPAASAQYQYPYPYTPPPVTYYDYPFLPPVAVQPYVPTTPPQWSFNPYTSGLSPCPQRLPGDLPCRYTMPPSYGQPNYRRQ